MSEIVDGTALPRAPSGARSTVWWGVALLVAIESTVIGSLVTSYYYLRFVRGPAFVPAEAERPPVVWPTLATVLLVSSLIPMLAARRAPARRSGRALRLGLGAALALLAGYAALSVRDAVLRPYRWDDHAYGSIVWTISGYQLLHVVAVALLAGATLVLSGRRSLPTEQDAVRIEATALYWYFLVLATIPVYSTLYVAPYVL